MRVLFISIECELLSIEYLSAALKLNGHETFLAIDPRLFDTELLSSRPFARILNHKSFILRKAKEINPDLICFSVCADTLKWALNLSLELKKELYAPIIFGGIHPTISPEFLSRYPEVDFVCVGEGEEAIVELANKLETSQDTTSIPNIWAKKDGRVHANAPRGLISEIDQVSFPDKEIYNKVYPRFMHGYKIITSRGCPYLCSYCANHQMMKIYNGLGKYYRRRSVQNVIKELVAAKRLYSLEVVRFFDDVFAIDTQWLKEFSDIYKREIGLPYFCFAYPENCDSEVISLLEYGGCKTVFMGLGTFSEEKRSSILRRNYSNKKVEELIRNFGKTKMYLIMDFVMGLPGQDRSEVLNMGNFFNNNRPDALSGLFLRYYPKTEITNLAVTSGLINKVQLNLLDNCGFKERIIIEENLHKWLKKVQCLILFSRYLPKEIVKLFYKIEIFKFFPAIDWNNFFVILDSTLPKLNRKTRIHTDTISLFQHLHFYAYHIGDLIISDFLLLYKQLKAPVKNSIKKWQLIYRLGIKGVKPLKLIMVMRYLFKTIILRENCPGAVIIGLTKKCQCKCVHCSVAYDSAISKEEMDVKKIKSLMNQVGALGIPKINLFGGEPLAIGEEIVGLVDHASKRGLSVSIDTNGILLTEALAKKLKQAGIDNINISLDSADKEIHDSLRGFSGAYDNATRAIDSCVRFGIKCIISTYASRRAIQSGDLVRIIDLGKRSRVTAVKILFPLMSGRWSHNCSELLSNKERFIVYGLLDPGFVYLESPLFSIRNGRKICEALDRKMIYVSPVGDMQACYAIPITFGNVNDEPLKKIMLRMWDSQLFTEVDNNHECVMNNPYFREEYFSKIKNYKNLPIYYKDIF